MSERLTREGEDQLRVLARTIGLSHELAPEIQEELFGHLEDQALAYLSGEEAITEDDAILLTREHFGDARALKQWLGSVHAPNAAGFRDLIPLAVVMLVGNRFAAIASHLVRYAAAHLESGRLKSFLMFESLALIYLVVLGLSILVLVFWRGREQRGSRVWWQSAPICWMVLAAVVLVFPLTSQAIQRLVAATDLTGVAVPSSTHPWVFALPFFSVNLIWPLIWLCWHTQPSRRWRSALESMAGYHAIELAVTIHAYFSYRATVLDQLQGSELEEKLAGMAQHLFTMETYALAFLAASVTLYSIWVGVHYGMMRLRPGIQ